MVMLTGSIHFVTVWALWYEVAAATLAALDPAVPVLEEFVSAAGSAAANFAAAAAVIVPVVILLAQVVGLKATSSSYVDTVEAVVSLPLRTQLPSASRLPCTVVVLRSARPRLPAWL